MSRCAMRAADWATARMLTTRAFELYGKTLGIIGFGNTGSELARRAHAFGMRILFNDVRDIDAEVVAACEEAGVTMVFTGERHFRH